MKLFQFSRTYNLQETIIFVIAVNGNSNSFVKTSRNLDELPNLSGNLTIKDTALISEFINQSVGAFFILENKNVNIYVYKFWYSPSNGIIASFVLRCLDLFIFKITIWKRRYPSVQTRNTTVIDFDICHRMATLRILYSTTLTYIFNIKHFKC